MTVKYHRKLNSLKTEVIEALILIGRYVKCYTPWAYQQIKLNVALDCELKWDQKVLQT